MVVWANLQKQLSLLGHFFQAGQIHHFFLIKSPLFWPYVLCPKKDAKEKLIGHLIYILKSHFAWKLSGCKEKKTYPYKKEYT